LFLKLVFVDETIDLHGAEEVTDTFADTALGNFLSQSEWRREGSVAPLRTQLRPWNQRVTRAAIPGAERQLGAAVDHGLDSSVAAIMMIQPGTGSFSVNISILP
jgi:hypothetical protein